MAMSPFYDDHGEDDPPDVDDDYMTPDEMREWDSEDEQERREFAEHGPMESDF